MRYRLLERSGLRVSEICLGTLSMGQNWPFGADEATSRKRSQIVDAMGATEFAGDSG